jgi:hypothetical protein
MRSPCCLCVCGSFPFNCWMPEAIFMKLCMYIMSPEPISTAYFINPSHQSVCLHVYPSYCCKTTARLSVFLYSVLGNVSVNTFPRQRLHTTIDACVWESVCVFYRSYSVKTLLRLRRIVGGVVFCAVRVVWKDSRLFFQKLLVYIYFYSCMIMVFISISNSVNAW